MAFYINRIILVFSSIWFISKYLMTLRENKNRNVNNKHKNILSNEINDIMIFYSNFKNYKE